MDAPASGALGSLVLRKAICGCGYSKHFLRAGASRDSREPQIPSRALAHVTLEYFLLPCGRSGSYSLRELRERAAAFSEFHGRTGAASSAKDRARKVATELRQRRSIRATAAFPEAESAT